MRLLRQGMAGTVSAGTGSPAGQLGLEPAAPAICERCRAPMVEDGAVARAAAAFAPAVGVRQWRCVNGHSVTWRAPVRPVALFLGTCDTCGLALLVRRPNMLRHAACGAEHDRRRKRRQPGVDICPDERMK